MKTLTLAAQFLGAQLGVLFLAGAMGAQTYQLNEGGRRCGADLNGQLIQTSQGPGIRFALRSRLDNSLAVLAIGRRAPAPIGLPGTPCQLFVDPRGTMLSMTDIHGNAHFNFRIPPVVPVRIAFQGVVVDVTPVGRRAVSSDVVRLTGQ